MILVLVSCLLCLQSSEDLPDERSRASMIPNAEARVPPSGTTGNRNMDGSSQLSSRRGHLFEHLSAPMLPTR